jgi:superfamily II DNA or RNA helicase
MSALTLRPLQARTMEALRESFRAGHRAVMLYGPTGFGSHVVTPW